MDALSGCLAAGLPIWRSVITLLAMYKTCWVDVPVGGFGYRQGVACGAIFLFLGGGFCLLRVWWVGPPGFGWRWEVVDG